jgi:hypothetical protein
MCSLGCGKHGKTCLPLGESSCFSVCQHAHTQAFWGTYQSHPQRCCRAQMGLACTQHANKVSTEAVSDRQSHCCLAHTCQQWLMLWQTCSLLQLIVPFAWHPHGASRLLHPAGAIKMDSCQAAVTLVPTDDVCEAPPGCPRSHLQRTKPFQQQGFCLCCHSCSWSWVLC